VCPISPATLKYDWLVEVKLVTVALLIEPIAFINIGSLGLQSKKTGLLKRILCEMEKCWREGEGGKRERSPPT